MNGSFQNRPGMHTRTDATVTSQRENRRRIKRDWVALTHLTSSAALLAAAIDFPFMIWRFIHTGGAGSSLINF